MPSERPDDFEVRLWHRGGEPEVYGEWGIATQQCRFKKIPGYLPERPRLCLIVDTTTLDQLYRDFREHHFNEIQTRAEECLSTPRWLRARGALERQRV